MRSIPVEGRHARAVDGVDIVVVGKRISRCTLMAAKAKHWEYTTKEIHFASRQLELYDIGNVNNARTHNGNDTHHQYRSSGKILCLAYEGVLLF